MKIISEPKDTVNIEVLKDGDIAIIVDSTAGCWDGKIVQRYYDNLVVLGQSGGRGISSYFPVSSMSMMRVKILKPGTQLEI